MKGLAHVIGKTGDFMKHVSLTPKGHPHARNPKTQEADDLEDHGHDLRPGHAHGEERERERDKIR